VINGSLSQSGHLDKDQLPSQSGQDGVIRVKFRNGSPKVLSCPFLFLNRGCVYMR